MVSVDTHVSCNFHRLSHNCFGIYSRLINQCEGGGCGNDGSNNGHMDKILMNTLGKIAS